MNILRIFDDNQMVVPNYEFRWLVQTMKGCEWCEGCAKGEKGTESGVKECGGLKGMQRGVKVQRDEKSAKSGANKIV